MRVAETRKVLAMGNQGKHKKKLNSFLYPLAVRPSPQSHLSPALLDQPRRTKSTAIPMKGNNGPFQVGKKS